jgi:hypothetical protein
VAAAASILTAVKIEIVRQPHKSGRTGYRDATWLADGPGRQIRIDEENRIVRIPMALVADDANLSQEGKLNVLGAFDRITAPSFPTVHPKMVFVIRIEASFGDAGRRMPVRVRLMDEDGGVLFEAGGELMAPEVQPGDIATAYQIFALMGIGFEKPGFHKFVVNLGEAPPYETPLVVVKGGWVPERTGMEN